MTNPLIIGGTLYSIDRSVSKEKVPEALYNKYCKPNKEVNIDLAIRINPSDVIRYFQPTLSFFLGSRIDPLTVLCDRFWEAEYKGIVRKRGETTYRALKKSNPEKTDVVVVITNTKQLPEGISTRYLGGKFFSEKEGISKKKDSLSFTSLLLYRIGPESLK